MIENQEPSPILEARIKNALEMLANTPIDSIRELYENNTAPVILVNASVNGSSLNHRRRH